MRGVLLGRSAPPQPAHPTLHALSTGKPVYAPRGGSAHNGARIHLPGCSDWEQNGAFMFFVSVAAAGLARRGSRLLKRPLRPAVNNEYSAEALDPCGRKDLSAAGSGVMALAFRSSHD